MAEPSTIREHLVKVTRGDVVTEIKKVLKDIKIEIDHCSDEIRDGLGTEMEHYKARRDALEGVYRWVVQILKMAQRLPIEDPPPDEEPPPEAA